MIFCAQRASDNILMRISVQFCKSHTFKCTIFFTSHTYIGDLYIGPSKVKVVFLLITSKYSHEHTCWGT